MAQSSSPKTEETTEKEKKVLQIDNREDFDKVIAGAGNKIILIEFFASWCGPCRMLAMKLEEWAALYNERAIIIKIDVDDFEEIAIEYDVTSMPTFLILKANGKKAEKVDMFVGSNTEKMEKSMEKLCGVSKETNVSEVSGASTTETPAKK